MLLGGAVGKSAQLPLQIWLPDAMAGPTPVSALIHAATMVTAGVYLIARTHVLFTLAPSIQSVVAIIGTLTLLLAAFSALTQKDIKRVLAYSTMSQIGYMFLALGVGAWSAALFHFMTHAFFKALLFLGAGVVIIRLDHEHDMFKMGGLRKELPVTFWSFLIGAASLSALPLVTAGFYSKDLILWNAWSSEAGSIWLWAGGLFGALLTSIYTFRMVFLTFFGKPSSLVQELTPLPRPGRWLLVPLVILAFLSLVGGLLEMPRNLGGMTLFSDFLGTVLPAPPRLQTAVGSEWLLQLAAAVASLGGIAAAYWLFLKQPKYVERWTRLPIGATLHRLWFTGWGFDQLDNELFVRPFLWLARQDQDDVVDRFYDGLARLGVVLNQALSRTQTGRIRQYAVGIIVGGIIVVGTVVLL
jgi:NADH-quinone oxidoreductase subunit L